MKPISPKIKNAIRIITSAAKSYDQILNRNNFIFIYKKRITNQIEYLEVLFSGRNFQYLTGIDFLDSNGNIIHFLKSSKMTAIYNSTRPKLSIDRLVGTTNFCLGFTKHNKYYVPSSCLLEDIRNLSDITFQVLAIFSKPASAVSSTYNKICYVAKGINLLRLPLSEHLQSLINLENYIEK